MVSLHFTLNQDSIEHRMVADLGRLALDRGISQCEILFRKSDRKRPSYDFFESIRHVSVPSSDDAPCILSASEAAGLLWDHTMPDVIHQDESQRRVRSGDWDIEPEQLALIAQCSTAVSIVNAAQGRSIRVHAC